MSLPTITLETLLTAHCCLRVGDCFSCGWLIAAQPKEFYDDANKRMDEWRDGWRDVDLDGDRGSGSGPAGRGDYQNVQEIIDRPQPACKLNLYP